MNLNIQDILIPVSSVSIVSALRFLPLPRSPLQSQDGSAAEVLPGARGLPQDEFLRLIARTQATPSARGRMGGRRREDPPASSLNRTGRRERRQPTYSIGAFIYSLSRDGRNQHEGRHNLHSPQQGGRGVGDRPRNFNPVLPRKRKWR